MHSKKFQRKLRKLRKQGMQYQKIKEIEDEFGEYFPEKKHRKVSNIILVIAIIAIVAYTLAAFVLQFYTSVEISSTLTTCWYSFWTVELVAMAGIKINKDMHNYNGEDYDDESHG